MARNGTKPKHLPGFLELYMDHCGTSEIPPQFDYWCALGLIAACIQNRVWLEKFPGSKLIPNMYIFLIGPSGIGKDTAIKRAIKLTLACPKAVDIFFGRITAPWLVEVLGATKFDKETKTREYIHNNLWLITPELANGIGTGPQADTFIKMTTDLYDADKPIEFQEGTRTSGKHTIPNLCFNWMAGSTREWLVESISREAVEGGFFARVIPIEAVYNPDYRVFRPSVPDNYNQLRECLQRYIFELVDIAGEVTRTPQALDVERKWYDGRPRPDDDILMPVWKREHDTMLKIAMLLSLSESTDLLIHRRHMIAAQRLSYKAQRIVPVLSTFGNTGARIYRRIEEFVHHRGTVTRSQLMGKFVKEGIDSRDMTRILDSLVEARRIKKTREKRTQYYTWLGRFPLESLLAADDPNLPPEEEPE